MDRSGSEVFSDTGIQFGEAYSTFAILNPPRQFSNDPHIFINNSWGLYDLRDKTEYKIEFINEMPQGKAVKRSNILIITARRQSQLQQ